MFIFQKNNLLRNRESSLTVAVILACLILAVLFPAEDIAQGLTKSLFFFVIIPILYIKFVLKKNISDFGLNTRNKKMGIFWGAVMLLVSLGLFYMGVKYTNFLEHYQISPSVADNFWFFLIYILIPANAFLFFQEFFFRGFVLSFLSSWFSARAIFIQVIIYFLAILLESGGFRFELWQFFPFIILSFTGGIVAYKSKSIIYSWIFGLVFLIMANSYIIYSIKVK